MTANAADFAGSGCGRRYEKELETHFRDCLPEFESQKTAIPRVLTDIQEDGNALQFDGAFKRYVKTEEFDEDKPNGYGKFKVFWLKRKK